MKEKGRKRKTVQEEITTKKGKVVKDGNRKVEKEKKERGRTGKKE